MWKEAGVLAGGEAGGVWSGASSQGPGDRKRILAILPGGPLRLGRSGHPGVSAL